MKRDRVEQTQGFGNHPGLRKKCRQIVDCAADVGQELVCRAGEG